MFDNRLSFARAVLRNRSMNRAHLSQLAVLATVAQCGSFRGAARELAIAPSAVSHAVSSLEARLGVRLLARSTRSVAPTEAGAQLLERLRPALSEIDLALETAIEARDRPAGNLRLTVPRTAAHLVADAAARRLCRGLSRHRAGDRHRGPLHRCGRRRFRCRRAARRKPAARHDRGAHRAGPSRRAWSARRPISRPCPSRSHPRDLADHRCIRFRFSSGILYRWEFEKDGEEIEIAAQGPLILDEDHLIAQAAVDGAGLAFVFEDYVRAAARRRPADPRAGGLVPALRRVLRLLSEPPPDAAGAAGLCRFLPDRRLIVQGNGLEATSRYCRPLVSPSSAPPSSTSSAPIHRARSAGQSPRDRPAGLADGFGRALQRGLEQSDAASLSGFGTKDIDLVYFDAMRCCPTKPRTPSSPGPNAHFAGLPLPVEVRNQARVHLWFEQRFGHPYPKLGSSADALTRFASRHRTRSASGFTPTADSMSLRRSASTTSSSFRIVPNRAIDNRRDACRKRRRAPERQWPEITVIPW